jgi:catechol 2,3-dioxygenase-like lactoylglutathione lyase family enzyme
MTNDERFDNPSLPGAVFHDCAMAGTRFADVDLSNSQFANVNMRGAHIRDANLSGVVIEDADIAGLTLGGCDVAALIAAQTPDLPAGLSAHAPRAFLPTRDFAASIAFYETLGFPKLLDSDVAIFRAGPGAFILTRRFDPVWAENCMMQLMVDDLEAGWTHIAALDLSSRFDVVAPRAPATQPWGLRVAYVFDPAGVLWHVAQRRAGVAAD